MAVDPRQDIYALLEGLEGGADLVVKAKAWAEEQVRKATAAATEKNTIAEQLAAIQAEKEAATARIAELESKVMTPEQLESKRIKELEATMQAVLKERDDAKRAEQETKAQQQRQNMLQSYLKEVNLKPEFAELLLEKKIMSGEIIEQDGAIGGLIGGAFVPLSEHARALEAANPSQLKVVAGGSKPAPNGGGYVAPTQAQAKVEAIEKRGGSMPTIV